MRKGLKLIGDKCIGCRSCEIVCSLANDGEMNPSKSRIGVITFLEGKYPLPYHVVATCKQCADAPCLSACPVEAVSRISDGTERLVIDRERCIGCGQCVRACPFGAMAFDRESKKAFKCELCGGSPACVAICPTGAIVQIEQEAFYAISEELAMKGYAIMLRRNSENAAKKVKK